VPTGGRGAPAKAEKGKKEAVRQPTPSSVEEDFEEPMPKKKKVVEPQKKKKNQKKDTIPSPTASEEEADVDAAWARGPPASSSDSSSDEDNRGIMRNFYSSDENNNDSDFVPSSSSSGEDITKGIPLDSSKCSRGRERREARQASHARKQKQQEEKRTKKRLSVEERKADLIKSKREKLDKRLVDMNQNRKRGPHCLYRAKDLDEAVAHFRSLNSGEKRIPMSGYRAIGRKFNVPTMTLFDHVNKTRRKTIGRPTILNEDEELAIVDFIEQYCSVGLALSRDNLCDIVQFFIKERRRRWELNGDEEQIEQELRFNEDDRPGPKWFRLFKSRHKDLMLKFPAKLEPEKIALTLGLLEQFFNNWIETVVGAMPECIINMDETAFRMSTVNEKVILHRNVDKGFYKKKESKRTLTILFAGTASGVLLPPMFVFRSENIYEQWMKFGPAKSIYACSGRGWITTDLLVQWVQMIGTYFEQLAKKKPLTKSSLRILLVDNFGPHIETQFLLECRKFDIMVVPLVANATHLLQPLDVSFFSPFKNFLRQAVTARQERFPGEGLDYSTAGAIVKHALNLMGEEGINDCLTTGFQRTGLYPVNPDVVLSGTYVCKCLLAFVWL
jgi:hypothetical protein